MSIIAKTCLNPKSIEILSKMLCPNILAPSPTYPCLSNSSKRTRWRCLKKTWICKSSRTLRFLQTAKVLTSCDHLKVLWYLAFTENIAKVAPKNAGPKHFRSSFKHPWIPGCQDTNGTLDWRPVCEEHTSEWQMAFPQISNVGNDCRIMWIS